MPNVARIGHSDDRDPAYSADSGDLLHGSKRIDHVFQDGAANDDVEGSILER